MKFHLILTIAVIVVIFRVNYVETIKCYVCNSVNQSDCKSGALSPSYLKSCEEVAKKKNEDYKQVIANYRKHSNPSRSESREYPFIDSYSNGSQHSQCYKSTMWIDGTERVDRGCSGLLCREDLSKGGCRKGTASSNVKSVQCYCDREGCNSSHRRLHPNNFWLNILLPIIICFINFLFN